MDSPFPPSSLSPGDGHIVVSLLPAGGSGLETMTYQYPLKLIAPSPSIDQHSILVFLLSYGGGLVAGDAVNLSIHVRPESRLSIATQGHTKIFKTPSLDITTRQNIHAKIDNDAGLCLLPDPVQPFEDSVYAQIQIFQLKSRASLCLLDWITHGRSARGENWSLIKWTGRNEVWLCDPKDSTRERLLVRDSVILSKDSSKAVGRTLQDVMQNMAVSGTLILRGDMMKSLGDFFLAEFDALPRIGAQDFRSPEAKAKADSEGSILEHWRSQRLQMERMGGVLWSAAQVRGCVIVKFGAMTVEAGREWIGSMIMKEGSISVQFGDQALMCIR
ncbi:UreD urease accessory protein-domain-containing protein [Dactylonectria estremocensis]|uniref:UreD urease accessory protein-domain-containing protein n=1 Tax=Dactylonectria estremocensis TaxID=1079267 RepID=A0A9P9F3T4_9HYPO|nr:UreD urease accessory protein-domain-containing protein [Dactylonectria estremocensis]